MKRRATVATSEEGVKLRGSRSPVPVNDVQFREAFGTSTRRMDVVPAKIPTEVESLLERQMGEVLVAERDHLALGDEESELVFAGSVELAELNAGDFRADGWS